MKLLIMFCIFGLLNASSALAIEVGTQPPEFGLASNRGTTVKLESYRGRVVFVDFWASWCSSCQHSLPWMNSLQQKLGTDQFQVIAINLDDNREAAERFLERGEPTKLLVGYDPTGQTPEAYGVKAMPTSVLISRDGKVAYIHEGFAEGDIAKLEQEIHNLLRKRDESS